MDVKILFILNNNDECKKNSALWQDGAWICQDILPAILGSLRVPVASEDDL